MLQTTVLLSAPNTSGHCLCCQSELPADWPAMYEHCGDCLTQLMVGDADGYWDLPVEEPPFFGPGGFPVCRCCRREVEWVSTYTWRCDDCYDARLEELADDEAAEEYYRRQLLDDELPLGPVAEGDDEVPF